MIGAKGPKMLRLAALHADTWSWFAEERSDLAEFEPRLAAIVDACVAAGRDPKTIGKSAGLVIEPTSVGGAEADLGIPVRGSPEAIADTMRAFGSAGFTNIEIVIWPANIATLDAMAPVIELLDAD